MRRQALRRIQSAAMPVGVTSTTPPVESSSSLAWPIHDPKVASPNSLFSATQARIQTEAAGDDCMSPTISMVVIAPVPNSKLRRP